MKLPFVMFDQAQPLADKPEVNEWADTAALFALLMPITETTLPETPINEAMKEPPLVNNDPSSFTLPYLTTDFSFLPNTPETSTPPADLQKTSPRLDSTSYFTAPLATKAVPTPDQLAMKSQEQLPVVTPDKIQAPFLTEDSSFFDATKALALLESESKKNMTQPTQPQAELPALLDNQEVTKPTPFMSLEPLWNRQEQMPKTTTSPEPILNIKPESPSISEKKSLSFVAQQTTEGPTLNTETVSWIDQFKRLFNETLGTSPTTTTALMPQIKTALLELKQAVTQTPNNPNVETYSAKINVYPQELGKITATIEIHEGKAELHMAIQNNHVKQFIETNMQQLQDSFSQANLDLTGVKIDMQFNKHHKHQAEKRFLENELQEKEGSAQVIASIKQNGLDQSVIDFYA